MVLIIHARHSPSRAGQIFVGAPLALIAVSAALELPLNLLGHHFLIENFINSVAAPFMAASLSPISPVATFLVIPSAIGLFLLNFMPEKHPRDQHEQNIVSIIGFFCAATGFLLAVSYLYGSPFFYNTQITPIAFTSALAGMFVGTGLIVAAGLDAFPLVYFSGSSTRARLLRVFFPLTIAFVLLQNLFSVVLVSILHVRQAIEFAVCLLLFCLLTSLVINKVTKEIGLSIDQEAKKRKEAEEILVKSQADLTAAYEEIITSEEERILLAAIVEYSDDAIIGKTLDGIITSWNAASEKIYGYTSAETVGKHISIIVPPDRLDELAGIMPKISHGDHVTHFETDRLKKNGSRIRVSLTISPIRSHDGRITGVSTIARDITELKETELSLKKSEEQYRLLFENMNEGFAYCRMFYTDRGEPIDFVFLNVNNAFERIIGTGIVIGKPVTEVFPGIRNAFPQLFEIYGRVTRTGKPESFEINFMPVKKWLFISVYSPSPEHFVAIFTDITDRKHAEKNLRDANEYLQNLINYANAPIIVWDPEFRITRFNHAFELLTGRTEKDVIGLNLGILFPETSRDASFEFIRKALSGERWEIVEIPILNVSGEIRIVLWNSANIVDPSGKIISIIAQGQDITDRKLTEAEREQIIKDLEQKNAELERFTYTASHDLKSPLITIRGFSDILAEDIKKNDMVMVVRDLDRINAAAQKMEILLKDLLNLSRIGRIVNPPENVPFGEIANEAVELLNASLQQHNVTVTIDPDMPTVCVDNVRVREALTNLVENAIKFMDDQSHPEIHIGVKYDEKQPVFFVRDNGIGIDPRYQIRIFNLFEKLDPRKEGSGAGLAIVKRIIEVHGGKIWVESAGDGSGSTFWFTLPVVPATGEDTV
ncbi:PAS domain S-box protein [Methanoregula sp.]|uniref:PAS domain-containing sensor histidine kinase n=1 Tax=Methanoregula sp. TaxID=2052170 RepID=UPI003BEDB319